MINSGVPRGHEKHVPTLPAFNPFRQTNMTNSQLNKDNQPSKASHQAGIDVGSEELVMVIRKNNKPFDPQKFANTPADRARLVKKMVKKDCLTKEGIDDSEDDWDEEDDEDEEDDDSVKR